jgi:hypothetical protein
MATPFSFATNDGENTAKGGRSHAIEDLIISNNPGAYGAIFFRLGSSGVLL